MVTCVIIANAETLSNPKRGSCSVTKSAGEMLAISIALSLRKLSVVRRLSASLRSHTLIVSELAVVAGVCGMTTTGRGNIVVWDQVTRKLSPLWVNDDKPKEAVGVGGWAFSAVCCNSCTIEKAKLLPRIVQEGHWKGGHVKES